jgi:D-3-phosphoglycerate dehydrogenase / 2-oxoglutarate reductase
MAAAAAQTGSHDRDFRAASAVEKSMRYRLLLSQLLPAPGMRVLATRADVAVAILPAPTEAALAAAIADADGVVLVLERPRLTAEMVRAAPRLRVVCRCGAGYDNIDVTALTERGIPLATSGAANADTVAEHALYLMLALAKRGPLLDRAVKGGGWPREFGAVELRAPASRRLRRDRAAHRAARRGFRHARRRRRPASGQRCGRGRPRRREPRPGAARGGFRRSCLRAHADDARPDRRRAARADAAYRLPGHVARGAVVDEKALAQALAAGQLAGAGLDVLETEPPRPGNPLLAFDNLVLTPHTAAFVETAYDRMAVKAAENVLAGLDGRLGPADMVNPEVSRSG